MDRNDRQAIDQLFEKLAAVEESSPQRDAASEAFINERIAEQPSAPYYMAQTIVVQNQALAAAEARIAELEGRNGAGERRAGSVPVVGRGAPAEPRTGVWSGMQANAQAGGGGFLAGAAQTALGVAGGFLLGNAIAGMFGGSGEAQAAETNPQSEQPQSEEPQADSAGADSAGYDDGGVDTGGFDGGFGDF
jgi:hypothetical protein